MDAIGQLAHEVHPEAFSEKDEIRKTKFETWPAFRAEADADARWECDLVRPLTPRRVAMDLPRPGLGVVCGGRDFAAHGGVSDQRAATLSSRSFKARWAAGTKFPSEFRHVVFGLRLPRIALGILVGASLATSGAGFQALLRNPLADPYVLGVSSGAALGAIISLIAAPHAPGLIQVAAFAGALATIAVVYFLGRRGGQLDSATLLLGGIITASFLSAVIMFLMTTLSRRDLRGMAFWLMGDLR